MLARMHHHRLVLEALDDYHRSKVLSDCIIAAPHAATLAVTLAAPIAAPHAYIHVNSFVNVIALH